MKNRPEKILLDLFCGAGGAGEGYRRAGFKVIGADIERHDYRPGEFVQADVMAQFHALVLAYDPDVIHASPPCQRYSLATATSDPGKHPDFIPRLREFLVDSEVPYVIENVPGAPLRDPIMLCGAMFSGLKTYRHRLFEIGNIDARSIRSVVPDHQKHVIPTTKMGRPPVDGEFMHVVGNFSGARQAREAMGIDWKMTRDDLREAIPPKYTEFIGNHIQKEEMA